MTQTYSNKAKNSKYDAIVIGAGHNGIANAAYLAKAGSGCHKMWTACNAGDGTAYFGASLLPWKPSYLVAVDAATGKVDGRVQITDIMPTILERLGLPIPESTQGSTLTSVTQGTIKTLSSSASAASLSSVRRS